METLSHMWWWIPIYTAIIFFNAWSAGRFPLFKTDFDWPKFWRSLVLWSVLGYGWLYLVWFVF